MKCGIIGTDEKSGANRKQTQNSRELRTNKHSKTEVGANEILAMHYNYSTKRQQDAQCYIM